VYVTDYDLFARLYDLEHRDFQADIELYHNFALRCGATQEGPPVLELGCGTGRVALALARAGVNVVGVDESAEMLALARAHVLEASLQEASLQEASLQEAGLDERVCLEQADVRALEWVERFPLAIYPLNGFLHLTTVSDQLSALHRIHRALLPGGFLIVDLPNPHAVLAPDAGGQLYLRRHFCSEQGTPITSLISTRTDLANQVQEMTLLYDEVGADGIVRRTAVELELRYTYRHEMAGLLRETGFELDAVHGSYDLDPYESDSSIMLFVAHT
jgi:SAM-dependent methyltransferase